ncbi:MAG TPA: MBL fold metallo-hydrolase [Solirubrobacteraceae bacterium]
MEITYIGGPTALLEIGGLRILTDPTFDPAGKRYWFGWGTQSRKLQGPAIAPGDVGAIDAVLLSHDHHDDNLDATGRTLLPAARQVITTEAGAARLGANALGLPPWASATVRGDDGFELRVTATPARHGPPFSKPIVGHVVGFVLQWEGQRNGAFWISGDSVWFNGLAEVGRRFDIGTAMVHLGGVRFPYLTGPARYTMNATEAVRVARDFDVTTLVPIHYEGWKHFREGRDTVVRTFREHGIADRVRWLSAGEPVAIDA